ncbi:MAG: hypothetical protein V4864_24910 [Pseudomonadota bacterium]
MAQSELAQAVEESQRLLRYASVKGIPLGDELVSDIVDAKALIGADENDSATFVQQKKFWQAQAKLAKETAPASIASIRFATKEEVPWWRRFRAWITRSVPEALPVGEIAVGRANLIALVWLVIVVALMAYSDTASKTLQSYTANQEIYEKNRRMLLLEGASAPSPEAANALKVANELLQIRTSRQLKIMDDWVFWRTFPGEPDSQGHIQAVLVMTEWLLVVLRESLLPVLWGVIGAALYVLRTLAQDLASMSYSRDHATLHRSRYYLGAVAGFVVAKFSTAVSGKVLDDAVQPMVLALLVGYSVDVLFNLLNKLIEVFTPKTDAARKPESG